MDTYGFIIIRHVNSEKTNMYWNQSVKLINFLYPDRKIVIIDDDSDYNFVKQFSDYKNLQIVQSEFPKRGEILPYYYFLKNKYFQNAVIIHDSVFLHKRINFDKLLHLDVIPLWNFEPDNENFQDIMHHSKGLISAFSIYNDINNITNVYSSMWSKKEGTKWYGCFGIQSFVNHNFLCHLENKYKFSNLLNTVKCRKDRCCCERIFGWMFYKEFTPILQLKSLFGDIRKYQTWGYSFDDYITNLKKGTIPRAVVKVWTGR